MLVDNNWLTLGPPLSRLCSPHVCVAGQDMILVSVPPEDLEVVAADEPDVVTVVRSGRGSGGGDAERDKSRNRNEGGGTGSGGDSSESRGVGGAASATPSASSFPEHAGSKDRVRVAIRSFPQRQNERERAREREGAELSEEESERLISLPPQRAPVTRFAHLHTVATHCCR
jgi:hypothetical protein